MNLVNAHESENIQPTLTHFHNRVIPCQITQKKTILNPTLSDFNEIWHTCWFQPQTANLKFFSDRMISFRDMQ